MDDESQSSRWSLAGTRVLWAGLGVAGMAVVAIVLVLMSGMESERISLIFSALGAVGSFGLLAVAVWAGVVGVKSMEASRVASEAATRSADQQAQDSEQRAADSRAASRPYMFVEVVPGLGGVECFDLKLTNSGRSAATGLVIRSLTPIEKGDTIARSVGEMFSTPRQVAPGQSLRIMWHIVENTEPQKTVVDEAGEQVEGYMGMPDYCQLQLEYRGPSGERYVEEAIATWRFAGQWPAPETGSAPAKSGMAAVSREPSSKHFFEQLRIIARQIAMLRY